MDFSQFGRKFTRHAGITQLMDDLNQGLLDPNAIMLGGGNPAAIPAMLEAFQTEAHHQLANGELLKSMINYDGPQGKDKFTTALAALLRQEYGWEISAKNIALTNGSQQLLGSNSRGQFRVTQMLTPGGDSARSNDNNMVPLAVQGGQLAHQFDHVCPVDTTSSTRQNAGAQLHNNGFLFHKKKARRCPP